MPQWHLVKRCLEYFVILAQAGIQRLSSLSPPCSPGKYPAACQSMFIDGWLWAEASAGDSKFRLLLQPESGQVSDHLIRSSFC